MNSPAVRQAKVRRILRNTAMALVLATAVGGVAARPALADDDGWHRGHERHEWRGHDRRDWNWREHAWREQERREYEWRRRHPFVFVGPSYAYAPPPVVYAPPPPPPSINFIFPLGR